MESDLDRVSADPRPEPLLLLLPPVSSPPPCRRCSCIPDITYSVVDSRPPVPWRAAGSLGISRRVCHCSCRELRDRYRGSFFFQASFSMVSILITPTRVAVSLLLHSR